jgi:hypothetical protein
MADEGVTLQSEYDGCPLQASSIGLLKAPPTGLTFTLKAAMLPEETVTRGCKLLRVKSVASPASETFRGLPAALLAMARVPVRGPAAVGVKARLMLHAEPAASVAGQRLLWEKSPLTCMPFTLNAESPALVTVRLRTWLDRPTEVAGKLKLEWSTEAQGPLAYPFSGMTWGEGPTALLWIRTAPPRTPGAAGENNTEIVQLPAGPTLVPQLSDSEKSPTVEMEEINKGALPMLRSSVVAAGLVEPMA